jgi:DNA replication initiation complex subunit (GINS family)
VSSETTDGSFFLSYSRSDERVALKLAKDLRAHGVAMWVDQLDIRPSEHWDRAIERAVTSCRGLVVIISPRSVASDNVADEISYAIDSGKSVLPVMIERCTLPLRLTRMQVVDAVDNYERALQQCLDELQRRAAPDASKPARPVRGSLDPSMVANAKQRMVTILGPIAGRLVDKAAARAGSEKELYSVLAQHIEDKAERDHFLRMASVPAAEAPRNENQAPAPFAEQSSIPHSELESITRAMAKYVGPIAAILVKREERAATSAEQLRQQLAGHISNEQDRAEFLRQTGPTP